MTDTRSPDNPWGHMNITVNGTPRQVSGTDLDYEMVLRLASKSSYFIDRDLIGATVVYHGPRHGDSQRSGTLIPGRSVKPEEGMHFTAVNTGSA